MLMAVGMNDFPVCPPRCTLARHGNVWEHFFETCICVCVSQEAADSLVEDFVITESAEAVEEAIAESTVQQVRGGTSRFSYSHLNPGVIGHRYTSRSSGPFLLWSPNSLQLPGVFSLYFGPIL